jgi:hypothetical protein
VIRVGASSAGGSRGVFATREIEAGQTIEVAPVIVVSRRDSDAVRRTRLDEYAFEWGGGCLAIALGCGSIYNHAHEPNASYWQDTAGKALEFIALRPIRPGEEITVNYHGNPGTRDKLWFRVREL